MTAAEPYSVELWIRPLATSGVFELTLSDHQWKGRVETKAEHLGLDAHERLMRVFGRGQSVDVSHGLAFGRALAARLFTPDGLGPAWAEIQQRRVSRPLRLELGLPPDDPRGAVLDGVPFELLADEGDGGFWFRRAGWSLVRTFEGYPAAQYRLPEGGRALLAWANPEVPNYLGDPHTIDGAIFAAHEEVFAREASALGCEVRPPLRRATFEALATSLRERPETPLLSLAAHGHPQGGKTLFHEAEASDVGTGVLARDLAKVCRDGGVKVALLWSCHGARRHIDRSSVAAALLHPDHGDAVAVVASHAALVASRTTRFNGPLLRSLRDVAEGDLERAVTEARHALPEDDLQWAAPVYYARPLQGESVSIEQRVERLLAESAPRAMRRVEGAPDSKRWFRGRGDELARLLGLVKAHRLTTLTGGPGIGKTTLAAEVARRAMSDTGFGLTRAVWLDLSTRRSAETLREALALVFGVDPARCKDDLALATALGELRALVVLDNAEDLLRADGGAFRALLDTLLRHAAGLRALVTSRRALGDLDGVQEQTVAVDRLPRGVDREVFVAVAGVRLPPDSEAAVVDALVAALAGHAQSIVLVAGQVGRGLSLPELMARVKAEDADLVRDVALLDDEVEETGDARLRTRRLVSSLNLSFHPLVAAAPGAAEMFAWLGNFPGGLPEVLLTGVFGEDAKRHLGRLLAHNMVERRGADDRLTLSGPVRWYARAQQRATVGGSEVIAAVRRAELLERSAGVVATWLGALVRQLGRPGAASACARAREDGANLGSLVGALGGEPDGAAAASGVGWAFYRFSQLALHGGYQREAEVVGEAVLGALREGAAAKVLAEACEALGDLYVRTARLTEAERVYGEALPLYRAIDARMGEANTQKALGDLYVRTDRLTEAERVYGQALPLYRAIDARIGEANTLQALGDLYVRTDRLTEAERVYGEALPLHRAVENRMGEANTQKALGDLYLRTERLTEAERVYGEALPIYRAIEDRLGEANTLQALGSLSLAREAPITAFAQYLEVLQLQVSLDDQLGIGGTHGYLTRAATDAVRFERAIFLGCRAFAILLRIDDRFGQMLAAEALLLALSQLNDPAFGAVIALVWALARRISHTYTQHYEPYLRQMNLDPNTLSPDALIPPGLTALQDLSARYEAILRDRNEDPYSPLDATPSPTA